MPVPLHPARQRERGFNQAAFLAERSVRDLRPPRPPVLERIRYTTTQTAFDRAERMENLRDAFRLRKKADVRGLHVLLIDDVLTTGSTLSECARVLKESRRALCPRRDRRARLRAMAIFKDHHLKERSGKSARYRRVCSRNVPGCAEVVSEIELTENQRVCPRCDYHFAQSAKERIDNCSTRKGSSKRMPICDRSTPCDFKAWPLTKIASKNIRSAPG